MVSVLKYATPLIGPWLNIASVEQYEHRFKGDIKLMEQLVKELPNIPNDKTLRDRSAIATFKDSYLERIEGASLRTLRELLDEKDPQQEWGGLRRVLTPEGHYLWLCEHHASAYLP
jgi:hypothetical protein